MTIDDGTMAVTDNYFKVPVPDGRARNEWVLAAIPPATAVDRGYGSAAGTSCFSASSMRPRNVSAACPSGTST